jgi:hypothetical protein
MADRFPHLINNSGTPKLAVMLPDLYTTEDATTNLSGVLGVTKARSDDDYIVVPQRVLRQAGKAATLVLRVNDSGAIKVRRVLCSIDKVASALGGLAGKTYDGHTIKSASLPNRRRLK